MADSRVSTVSTVHSASGDSNQSKMDSTGSNPAQPPDIYRSYTLPDCYSSGMRPSVRKWIRLHEKNVHDKLREIRQARKDHHAALRAEATRIARKIPLDLLAKEWLQTTDATVDTRAYLADEILPILIMGVEKLLMEVDKRGLSERAEVESNFNPLNFLAQYLMRNNPKYNNYSEASPYIYHLRKAAEELKQQVFSYEDNKIARMKTVAKLRREERKREMEKQKVENERKLGLLESQFPDWVDGVGGVTASQTGVQSGLLSFVDIVASLPEEMRPAAEYEEELEPTDSSGLMMSKPKFCSYVLRYTRKFPSDIFDLFVEHMRRCAVACRDKAQKSSRMQLLGGLFYFCDKSNVGQLDRHRVIHIFEKFWDDVGENVKSKLRNPRRWPIVEFNEAMEEEQLNEMLEDESAEYDDDEDDDIALTEADDEEEPAEQPEGPAEGEDGTPARTPGAEAQPDDAETKPDEPEEENEPDARSETGPKSEGGADGSEQGTSVPAGGETPGAEDEERSSAGGAQPTSEGGQDGDTDRPVTSDDIPRSSEGKREEGAEEDQDTAEVAQEDPDQDAPRTAETTISGVSSRAKSSRETPLDKAREVLAKGSFFSVFDENSLNVFQFVQLVETFLADKPKAKLTDKFISFMKQEYVETEDDKLSRLARMRQGAMQAKRRNICNEVFDKWDNDGSGFLDLEEVLLVFLKFREGSEQETIEIALEIAGITDNRMNKKEFRDFIITLGDQLPGGDSFDDVVWYLQDSIERTYGERIRGKARKKWLNQIVIAAETGGASMEPVYRALFHSLYRDAEVHGNAKKMSAHISLLEMNDVEPARGETLLRCIAATPDDASLMIGTTLFKDMKNISFAAIDTGKPVHIPRVAVHGGVHFYNAERFRGEEPADGSFISIPLKDDKKRVFGTMGVDTIRDPQRAIFVTHEISYYQGVAKSFSTAFHHVDLRRKTLRLAESAVNWIHRRGPHVHEITVYMVEPCVKDTDEFVLRKMMVTDQTGSTTLFENPVIVSRRDNLFREYLFKCVDNSETVTTSAYGERHTAFPLRDDHGRATTVIDINIGEQRALPKHENREVQRMLRLLQTAHDELTSGVAKKAVLEVEKKNERSRIDVMFDRIMLQDLRVNVTKLDSRAWAELKSYKDPPKVIHDIIRSVQCLFRPSRADSVEMLTWNACKQGVTSDLIKRIGTFDPTASINVEVDPSKVDLLLAEVPHGEVLRYGSQPAEHLYNWVFVCISLIEHMGKMKLAQHAAPVARPTGEEQPTPNPE